MAQLQGAEDPVGEQRLRELVCEALPEEDEPNASAGVQAGPVGQSGIP